jgi:hypothetical protein
MREHRLARYAPLAGVVFVALIVLAVIIGGETPSNGDSALKIARYWKDHDTEQIWTSVIGAWATVFFVWFAATLRSTLRKAEEGTGRVSAACFGGAIVGATGFLTMLGINFAIADGADDLSAPALKTLTVFSNGFFLPLAVGFAVFFLAAGILAVRFAVLPAWLGWFTIVLGVACVTPVGFFALLVGLVWILVVSIMLYRREAGPAERPAPMEPTAPAPAT